MAALPAHGELPDAVLPDDRARSDDAGRAEVGVNERRRWAQAGLSALTGAEHGPPLDPPPHLVRRLDRVTERIAAASRRLGDEVVIDGLAELAARAEPMALRRRGRVSCGGACQLVRATDGWFAVSLAREDDWDLLPAWIGLEPVDDGDRTERWAEVHARCRTLPVGRLVTHGALLGLPIGALPAAPWPGPVPAPGGRPLPGSTGRRRATDLLVVDLSTMWAGPLAGAVLAAAGARVVKVESSRRPDGARLGPPELFDRWNSGKEHIAVDLSTDGGRREIEHLVRSADVVIESSRPRALAQLGIDADALVNGDDGPSVWVSITGHGRTGDAGLRVAFGDDAAVAGGLVTRWEGEPCFVADAVADPLTGLVAAAAALEAVAVGARGLLDVPMARVAAHFAAPHSGAVVHR